MLLFCFSSAPPLCPVLGHGQCHSSVGYQSQPIFQPRKGTFLLHYGMNVPVRVRWLELWKFQVRRQLRVGRVSADVADPPVPRGDDVLTFVFDTAVFRVNQGLLGTGWPRPPVSCSFLGYGVLAVPKAQVHAVGDADPSVVAVVLITAFVQVAGLNAEGSVAKMKDILAGFLFAALPERLPVGQLFSTGE